MTLDGGVMLPSAARADSSESLTEPRHYGRIRQRMDGMAPPQDPEKLLAPLLAMTWARSALRAGEAYTEAGEGIPNINCMVEKLEAEMGELVDQLQEWYAQGHYLVLSLLHMEEWYLRAGGRDAQTLDVVKLRHSLEHLVDAELRWDRAVPDPASRRKRWSMDDLPSGSVPLHFDIHMIDSIFGLIDLATAVDRAERVYNEMAKRHRAPAGEAFFPPSSSHPQNFLEQTVALAQSDLGNLDRPIASGLSPRRAAMWHR